ncbi:NUDIX domain-containing protein [Pseudoduganella sp. GCM10020061]|uniref:NUDIX hydrolase n=1 Tax=Pseudoduganella sp. GCM10020061 TaxID=3317345 RepID=UPI0036417D08
MYPISVKGVLETGDGEVVLLHNERNEWELPGGRIEDGETPQECLAREIMEELGLSVRVGPLLDSYVLEVVPGKRVFIVTYGCTLEGPFAPVISDEHTQFGAFPPDSLPHPLPSGYRASIDNWISLNQGA